jgi:hypothetical protein
MNIESSIGSRSTARSSTCDIRDVYGRVNMSLRRLFMNGQLNAGNALNVVESTIRLAREGRIRSLRWESLHAPAPKGPTGHALS